MVRDKVKEEMLCGVGRRSLDVLCELANEMPSSAKHEDADGV